MLTIPCFVVDVPKFRSFHIFFVLSIKTTTLLKRLLPIDIGNRFVKERHPFSYDVACVFYICVLQVLSTYVICFEDDFNLSKLLCRGQLHHTKCLDR